MPIGSQRAALLVLFSMWTCSGLIPTVIRRARSLCAHSSAASVAVADSTRSPFASPAHEIARRRNLAIIAHPDAGKTTLTEKLLLYGGALQQAGAVRTRADQRAATSDWMELEKQRGISITSTVLTFDYQGNRVNLLDTPGRPASGIYVVSYPFIST